MITSPTLLVDEQKCKANIRRMAEKARRHDLEFRPHFKTHQSTDIGEWFRNEGVNSITVSSVKMANYFAESGWNDITIAFPINLREIEAINRLSNKVSLTILISDPEVCKALQNSIEHPIEAMIEIDTGSDRTGFTIDQKGDLNEVITGISKINNLQFKGFYSHPGHSYSARSKEEIREIHAEVLAKMSDLVAGLSMQRDAYTICIGDTPCSTVASTFKGIDQVSPGNLVFYDLMQAQIGSCTIDEIAVALACPIVAKYPSKNELVIHGGAVHLSKEKLKKESKEHFGYPVYLTGKGWEATNKNGFVKSLSQEHGIVTCTSEFMESVGIGELIGILPVHSCLTADLMSGYRVLEGRTLNHIRAPK